MPQISVIVPVYKVEPYLRRCADSILGQTFYDLELILVDDGSPDGCPTICDEYARKDSRVVVIHQKNGGLSAARNAGIDWVFANSDSQWLTFIDSDDWVHPAYLERLLSGNLEYGTDVSICALWETDGLTPELPSADEQMEVWNTEDFFVEHNINATVACAKLYRKTCFEHIRYPVGKLHEDEFTTYKILFSLDYVSVTAANLYYYYQNPTGIVRSRWTMARLAGFDALEEQICYFSTMGFDDACRAVIRRYLCGVSDKLELLSGDETADEKVLKELKRRKKVLFKEYRKALNTQDNRDAWVLSRVYPHRMWMYWHWQALKKKICNFRSE